MIRRSQFLLLCVASLSVTGAMAAEAQESGSEPQCSKPSQQRNGMETTTTTTEPSKAPKGSGKPKKPTSSTTSTTEPSGSSEDAGKAKEPNGCTDKPAPRSW